MEVLRQNLVPEIVLFLLVLSFATVTDGKYVFMILTGAGLRRFW